MRPTAIVFLVAMAFASAASAQHTLAVQFGSHDAVITGLTPGGRAIVFAAGLAPQGQYSLMFEWAGTADDADHHGSVSVDFGRDIPGSSIWCVADGTTGDYLVISPKAPVPVATLLPNSLRRRGGTVSQVVYGHAFLDLLYIEPGRGAWIIRDADGSRTDEDGPNGATAVSTGRMKPLWEGLEAPAELRPGGVLVAIDRIRFEAAAVRLDAAMIGAAQ